MGEYPRQDPRVRQRDLSLVQAVRKSPGQRDQRSERAAAWGPGAARPGILDGQSAERWPGTSFPHQRTCRVSRQETGLLGEAEGEVGTAGACRVPLGTSFPSGQRLHHSGRRCTPLHPAWGARARGRVWQCLKTAVHVVGHTEGSPNGPRQDNPQVPAGVQ